MRRRHPLVPQPCFNGAATLSLRKPVHYGITARYDIVASMGPQLYRCGNTPWSGSAGTPGRSFNGAATLSLRKLVTSTDTAAAVGMLQWGRNFIVAETHHAELGMGRASSASMGPQLYRCGNILAPSWDRSFPSASMGPQLYRCGNM